VRVSFHPGGTLALFLRALCLVELWDNAISLLQAMSDIKKSAVSFKSFRCKNIWGCLRNVVDEILGALTTLALPTWWAKLTT
jgi:hypothetical protein